MAAGDFTRADPHLNLGSAQGAIFTLELDNDPRGYDLIPNGYIHFIVGVDEDGVASAQLSANQDSSGATQNGSVRGFCNAPSTETFRVLVIYSQMSGA